jgi:hypothetical protein
MPDACVFVAAPAFSPMLHGETFRAGQRSDTDVQREVECFAAIGIFPYAALASVRSRSVRSRSDS